MNMNGIPYVRFDIVDILDYVLTAHRKQCFWDFYPNIYAFLYLIAQGSATYMKISFANMYFLIINGALALRLPCNYAFFC